MAVSLATALKAKLNRVPIIAKHKIGTVIDSVADAVDLNTTHRTTLARGSIYVGGTSNAKTALVAKTDKQILIGDGNDVKSVAVTGDVTIGNTGVTAIGAGKVLKAMLGADCVDGTKIGDDAVDSEHIADGAIDLAHMSANSVDSDQYVDGSIDLAHMSANSVDSDQYVDGSIDTEHLAATTTPNAKAITAAHEAEIPVTGNGYVALTIANAAETNDLPDPTFAGQEITIFADTVAGTGSRTVTAVTAVNAAGNNTILFDAAGEFIVLRGIKLGAGFVWRVVAVDGATLSTEA